MNKSEKSKISILCSGVALGVYIPAILIYYQLKKANINIEVIVLENLLADDKKSKLLENKKAFHKNFRFALTGQKMAKDLWPFFDKNIINELFKNWISEKRKKFIIFSGFWMSVINEYSKLISPEKLDIDIIHMDADISASWKNFQDDCKQFNNIWLFDWKEKRLIYNIPVTAKMPLTFNNRKDRFVIHGGGWGMGTYQSKISELTRNVIKLDIIAYDISEADELNQKNRFYMIDPAWSPWIKNKKNIHEFPPFGEVKKNKKNEFKNKEEYHELYDLISQNMGIISKPGGATLVDSLSSATPLIMLEPFGDYEQKNSELWKELGFGIYYDEWEKLKFSKEILKELHENLIKSCKNSINYIMDYILRYKNQEKN